MNVLVAQGEPASPAAIPVRIANLEFKVEAQ